MINLIDNCRNATATSINFIKMNTRHLLNFKTLISAIVLPLNIKMVTLHIIKKWQE